MHAIFILKGKRKIELAQERVAHTEEIIAMIDHAQLPRTNFKATMQKDWITWTWKCVKSYWPSWDLQLARHSLYPESERPICYTFNADAVRLMLQDDRSISIRAVFVEQLQFFQQVKKHHVAVEEKLESWARSSGVELMRFEEYKAAFEALQENIFIAANRLKKQQDDENFDSITARLKTGALLRGWSIPRPIDIDPFQ